MVLLVAAVLLLAWWASQPAAGSTLGAAQDNPDASPDLSQPPDWGPAPDPGGALPDFTASMGAAAVDAQLSWFGGQAQDLSTSQGGATTMSNSIEAQKLVDAAAAMQHNGQNQFYTNGCADAVSACFANAGYASQLPQGDGWVPNWASFGTRIPNASDLRPGDIVIYNEHKVAGPPNPGPGGAGYDHIGVFQGVVNGVPMVYNVSSAHGHQFVPTPLWGFQEGRRP